jgi:hypothetical protein
MDKKLKMYGIPSALIDSAWVDVSPYIKEALQYSDGKYEISDIYKSLIEKDMQLWTAFSDEGCEALCVTQIINYPRKKVLLLFLIAGKESANWLHFVENLKHFAKEHGCDSLEGYGRPGWEKLSKPLGFKKVHTIFKLTI